MHLEVFSEGNSFLHRADPRVKLLLFCFFSVLCSTSQGVKSPLLFLSYSLFLLLISKLKIKLVLTRLIAANVFIFLLWIFLPLNYRSSFSSHPYWEGLIYPLSITLKCNAILLATITLLSTSSIFSLAHAMRHLKVPAKFVTIFFLFYRYITVIHEEYEKIRRAAILRGFVPKTNIHTYRTYAYMIGGLLLKSLDRAEDIYRSILCRGFKGEFPLLFHFRLDGKDVVFGLVSAAILSIIRGIWT